MSLGADFSKALPTLLDSGDFADLELVPRSGPTIAAHAVVLVARCPHFASLLKGKGKSGAPIRLALDVEHEVLLAVLAHCYRDELPRGADAEPDTLLRLRSVALDWGLAGLDAAASQALVPHLASAELAVSVVGTIAREAARARLADAPPPASGEMLRQTCGQLARCNFASLRAAAGFDELAPAQKVWLFAQSADWPLHVWAGGVDAGLPDEDLLQALLVPPFSCGLDAGLPQPAAAAAPAGSSWVAGATPLHVALALHRWAASDLLLDAGASPQPLGAEKGRSLLHAVAAAGDAEACKYLARRAEFINAADEDGASPFDLAILGGHAPAARTVRDLGGGSTYAANGNPLMHHLAATGLVSNLCLLLELDTDGLNARNDAGCTALTVSALHGQLESSRLLCEAGADVNRAPSGGGLAPIHLAASHGHAPIVMLLLEFGAQVDAKTDPGCQTPLHISCAFPPCAQLLLEHRANIDARDATGMTPLLFAAMTAAPLEAFRLLLRAGAKPNYIEPRHQQAALHLLCEAHGEGAAAALTALVSAGASLNAQDRLGQTPLHLAAFCGRDELALALVSAGASPNIPCHEGKCALSATPPTTTALSGKVRGVSKALRTQMLARISAPLPWLADHLSEGCQICGGSFSKLRRHHCRHCGRLVCKECSKDTRPIPKFGELAPLRVCTECVPVLAQYGDRAVTGSEGVPAPDTSGLENHLDRVGAIADVASAPAPRHSILASAAIAAEASLPAMTFPEPSWRHPAERGKIQLPGLPEEARAGSRPGAGGGGLPGEPARHWDAPSAGTPPGEEPLTRRVPSGGSRLSSEPSSLRASDEAAVAKLLAQANAAERSNPFGDSNPFDADGTASSPPSGAAHPAAPNPFGDWEDDEAAEAAGEDGGFTLSMALNMQAAASAEPSPPPSPRSAASYPASPAKASNPFG